jgi:hypothetical protein
MRSTMFIHWRKQLGAVLTLAMMLSGVLAVQAAAPANIITYQGRVLNANGVPVSDTSLSISFALYTASSGGTCVWSNSSASCASVSARSVTLTTGLFTENLGDTSASYAAIGDSIFGDNTTLYLEVIIAGETLTPRRLITAAPYALNAQLLDGIDSTTLQLFEVGTNGSYEDDVATIIGVDAAFSYGSGGVGDLRVADEIEVLGDGYIDNDLVVGASTSSTETISNGSFSLGGDDLFVAGDGGIEGSLYIDGGFNLVGTATVGDLACTDCLDFTELSDTLALDASTSITMDNAESFTFTNGGTADFIVNLSSTGDFVVQDGGIAALTVNDSGNTIVAGDLTISGDDLIMGTNTSGFLMVADGTNYNPVALSGDATLASTGALTIAADAVTLSTDTTGNYVATIADAGNTTMSVTNGSAEGGAVTLDVIDVNCTDCLSATEISDVYLLNSGDTTTGDVDFNDGSTDSPKATFSPASGTAWDIYAEDTGDDLQIEVNSGSVEVLDIVNVGAGVVNLTLDGDLTISGDDLIMGTNTSGFLMVADGTNYNPVALSGDATLASTGALTIAADAVTLSTDTTGNYVATLTDAGGSDFTITGSGAEGAAVTIDMAADAIDWDEMVDAMTLDASTSITMDGSETFTITNGSTDDVIFNLSSTGDFVVQDAGSGVFTFTDGGILEVATGAGGIDIAGTLFDLDADNDTSVRANTDDQIDWEIGGTAQTLIMRGPLGADDASSTVNPILEVNYATPADTTGTNIHAGIFVDLDIGNATGGTNRVYGLAFEAMTGDAEITALSAIRVESLTGSAASETAINIADGWDAGIYIEGTTPNIWTADGSRLSFEDPSGNDIFVLSDVSAVGHHVVSIDSDTSFTFDSSADTDVDISTASNEMLLIKPDGTGDTRFEIDDNSVVELVATAAPGVDMFTITNSGQATTTADVNALSITHSSSNASTAAISLTPAFAGGASNGLLYQGFAIEPFSPSNAAGADTVVGINIETLTDPGATISSYAIQLDTGWDSQVYFNDSTSIITLVNAGTLTVEDSAGNTLAIITDNGTTGLLTINSITSPDDVILNMLGGFSGTIGVAGQTVQVIGGTNNAGGSGGNGGAAQVLGGDAVGDGTSARDGGTVLIQSGDSTVSTGNAGNVQLVGGASTSGQTGNIEIQSGGSPTAVSVDGGDIALTADDDIFISADDDVTMDVVSSSAVVNLFDNAVSKTIEIGGVTADAADTVRIASNLTTADNIQIGNSNAGTLTSIVGGSNWNVATTGIATFSFTSSGSFALCHSTNGAVTETITDCSAGPTADYAEQYAVALGIGYGDIVVPGSKEIVTTQGDTMVQLVKSSQAYQGPVVGIVSDNYGDFTSAGYNIDEADNPMPVALVGRVPVKVVDEGGSISVGDYLTTSSTPGAAMRATKVGRVIGMALEDWDGVSGTLMVQVNNSWSMGDVIGTDGTSTLVTDNVIVSEIGTANHSEPSFDSYGLALRGSAYNGSEAQTVELMLRNVVETPDSYRLSISNTTQTEVAYITNQGTMKIAGDMVIGGRLYPSDRGTPQKEKYIYYDGSSGPGGDFMRTNAKGWSTGSYDFAEMFPSSEPLVSGDIVAFAGSGESVVRATSTNAGRLAGIVSTRPGFLAGENVAGAYPIALAGRVPTKVNLENGAIAVGDPLTKSSSAGVAMKAREAGQIVGYALEAYTGSESDNLVLTYVNVGYWSGGPQTNTIFVQNSASQAPTSSTSNFSALNMSGNIFMATHSILSIGRLEGISGIWSIESDGTIKTQGQLTTITDSYQGTKVETVAVTSPESMITLTGTTQLVDGKAEVRFESVVPEYNDVISAIAPIRVIVTPSGPVSLYVSQKDQNHFVVQRFAGSADVEFDWMVTGYRKGYEPEEEPEIVQEEIVEEESVEVIAQEEEPITEESVVEEVTEEEPEEESAEQVIEEPEEEIAAEEELAAPESPDETFVDSPAQPDPAFPETTEGDDGASAEQPPTS